MTTQNVSRLIYFQVMLFIGLTDWLIAYFNPEANAGNWLAGVAGAFLLRLLIQVSARKHLTGWLVGSIAAFLWAPDLQAHWLTQWSKPAVWGMVGFLSDFVLQIIVYVASYARDHPSEAFDAGMEKAEKLTTLWTRIKEPVSSLLEFIQSITKKPS